MEILIVEDSKTDRLKLTRFLGKIIQNIQLRVASTIEEGLRILNDENNIQCIVTDYLLPDGTGIELISKLNSSEVFREIPSLLLTGEGDERIAVQAIRAGAFDYIVKKNMTLEILSKSLDAAFENSKLKKQIREDQEKLSDLSALIEHSSDMILVADANNLKLLNCNPSACKRLNLIHFELDQICISDLIGPEKDNHFNFSWDKDSIPPKPFEAELKIQSGKLETIPVQLSVNISETRKGSKIFIVAHDLSERKKIEDLLKTDKDRALKISEFKSEFLARMSHDIRTPLNSIVGLTDVLQDTPLNSDQKRHLDTLSLSCGTLLNLINDILDISKIEAGELTIESEDFDFEQMLIETVNMLEVQAKRKSIPIYIEIKPLFQNFFNGDKFRIQQILTNLISNAIKFTSTGRIDIQVTIIENEKLKIAVSDTGIGISKDQLETVFDSYKQAKSNISHTYGGTGLGLAICKSLITLMGGEIQAHSNPGKGSTFTLTLPIESGEPLEILAKMESISHSYKFYLYSPRDRKSQLIMNIFRDLNCPIQFLDRSGFDSIEKNCQKNGFLIVNFPSEKNRPFTSDFDRIKNLFKYVLDTSETSDSGCLDSITYPIERKKLIEKIAQTSYSFPKTKSSGTFESKHIRKILVADDIELNRNLINLYLKAKNLKVVHAKDGLEAFEIFRSQKIDFILMDMLMPVMNGIESVKKIRSWEKSNHKPEIPIYALTANAFTKDSQTMIDAACNGFLPKPVRKSELLKLLLTEKKSA